MTYAWSDASALNQLMHGDRTSDFLRYESAGKYIEDRLSGAIPENGLHTNKGESEEEEKN